MIIIRLSDEQAWATIAKVNISSFLGDNIFFKKGDIFIGQLKVSSSGTVDSPITFGAYETGANPIILGMPLIQDVFLYLVSHILT